MVEWDKRNVTSNVKDSVESVFLISTGTLLEFQNALVAPSCKEVKSTTSQVRDRDKRNAMPDVKDVVESVCLISTDMFLEC